MLPEPPSEVTFHEGELALVLRSEASHFRMREIRRVAIRLSPDDAARLAKELGVYVARARREGALPHLDGNGL